MLGHAGLPLPLAWLSVFATQWCLLAALAPRLSKASFARLFAVAVLARLLVLPSTPVLENDYLRYLWDGRVLAHGVNPYRYAPNAPELDAVATSYRASIGWSAIPTIYPPLAQVVFAGLHLAWRDSLLALKLVFTAFDLATGVLIASALRRRSLPATAAAWYLLNPLVLKEIANSAHLDSIAVFFCAAAVLAMSESVSSRARLGAWALLGAAVAAKLYPVLLVPLFFKIDDRRWRGLGVLGAVLFLFFAPFAMIGKPLLGGLGAYALYWRFNPSAFAVMAGALGTPWAKACAAVVLTGWIGMQCRALTSRDRLPAAALSSLGALLLLSPVVDAWYALWLLPFACLERSRAWLAFSALVGLAYLWFFDKQLAVTARVIEYGALFALLALDKRRKASAASELRWVAA